MYNETGDMPVIIKKGSEFYKRTAKEHKKHSWGTCIPGPGARAPRPAKGFEAPGPPVHGMSFRRPWPEAPGLLALGMSFPAGRKHALRGASCRPWARTLRARTRTEARS